MYKSHKFKNSGLRYEVGVGIQGGDIVWVNGPYPCGKYNDIKIFKDGMKKKLSFCEEKVEADDGYRGEDFYIELPKKGTKKQRTEKTLARGRHETVNNRFKFWNVLKERFRQKNDDFHGHIVKTICTITQMEIRTGHSLFPVRYKTVETNKEKEIRLRLLEMKKKSKQARKK